MELVQDAIIFIYKLFDITIEGKGQEHLQYAHIWSISSTTDWSDQNDSNRMQSKNLPSDAIKVLCECQTIFLNLPIALVATKMFLFT